MFRSILAAAAALLIITGCGRSADGDAAPAARSSGIGGRWVVQPATIDGVKPFGHRIRVSIEEGRIRAMSQCIWFDWDYTAAGETIEVVEHRFTPTPDQAYPPPMCARGLHPQERRFADAMLAARTARRLQDGRLLIDGPRGEIRLAPDAEPVTAPERDAAPLIP